MITDVLELVHTHKETIIEIYSLKYINISCWLCYFRHFISYFNVSILPILPT
jgi:hypothetical protein